MSMLIRNDDRFFYPYVDVDDSVYWTIEDDGVVLWEGHRYRLLDLLHGDKMDSMFARLEIIRACRAHGVDKPMPRCVHIWGEYRACTRVT